MIEIEKLKGLEKKTKDLIISLSESEKFVLTLEKASKKKTVNAFYDECVEFEKGNVSPEMLKSKFQAMNEDLKTLRVLGLKEELLDSIINTLKS